MGEGRVTRAVASGVPHTGTGRRDRGSAHTVPRGKSKKTRNQSHPREIPPFDRHTLEPHLHQSRVFLPLAGSVDILLCPKQYPWNDSYQLFGPNSVTNVGEVMGPLVKVLVGGSLREDDTAVLRSPKR